MLQTKEGKVRDAKEHVDKIIRTYDTDGDGTLNKAEFVRALHEDNIFRFFDWFICLNICKYVTWINRDFSIFDIWLKSLHFFVKLWITLRS